MKQQTVDRRDQIVIIVSITILVILCVGGAFLVRESTILIQGEADARLPEATGDVDTIIQILTKGPDAVLPTNTPEPEATPETGGEGTQEGPGIVGVVVNETLPFYIVVACCGGFTFVVLAVGMFFVFTPQKPKPGTEPEKNSVEVKA